MCTWRSLAEAGGRSSVEEFLSYLESRCLLRYLTLPRCHGCSVDRCNMNVIWEFGYWSDNALSGYKVCSLPGTGSLAPAVVAQTWPSTQAYPLLEFRATWGQKLLRHQQPVVLINLGTEGRNHLPSCVPISSRATALVCFHISGECSKTHARPTGALFSTLPLDFSFFLLMHTHTHTFLPQFLPQVYPSWLRKSLCCHFCFQHSNQNPHKPCGGTQLWPVE